jgi:hypothetical protein
MSAAENKFEIMRALQMLRDAAGNGAAAMTEVNEALALFRTLREKMENSRIHALQELGDLNSALNILEVVSQGSNSQSLHNAVRLLRDTRKLVEDYSNGLTHRTASVGRTINQLEKFKEDTLNKSGVSFEVASLDLRDYMETL